MGVFVAHYLLKITIQSIAKTLNAPKPNQNPNMKKSVLRIPEKHFKDLADGNNTPSPPDSPPKNHPDSELATLFDYLGIDDETTHPVPTMISCPINVQSGRARTRKHKSKKGKRKLPFSNLWKITSKPPAIPKQSALQTRAPTHRGPPSENSDADHYLGPDYEPQLDIRGHLRDSIAISLGQNVNHIMRTHVGPIGLGLARTLVTINLMAQAETWPSAAQTLFLYISGITPHEDVKRIVSFVFKVIGVAFTFQDDIQVPGKSDTGDLAMSWLTMFRNARKDWGNVKSHPLFTNFSKLFAIMTYTGVLNLTKGEWSEEFAMALFPEAQSIIKTRITSWNAMADVAEYIAESLYRFSVSGNLMDAFGDTDNPGLPQQLATIQQEFDLFRLGNLVRTTGKENHVFQLEVTLMIRRLRRILDTCSSPTWTHMYTTWYLKLENYAAEIRTILSTIQTRAQPYSIYLDGLPGQGKSHLTTLLGKYILLTLNGDYTPNDVYTRVCSDAYWSDMKSSKKQVHFDDMGSAIDPTQLSRQMNEYLCAVGVSKYAPPMSDTADKGKVQCNPDLVTANGNGIFPGLASVARNPEAFARRVNVVGHVVAKPQFCKADLQGNLVLNSEIIAKARADGVFGGSEIEEVVDIYLFDLVFMPGTSTLKKIPMEVNGNHKVTTKQFLEFTASEARSFVSSQKTSLLHAQTVVPNTEICGLCDSGSFASLCSCPKPPIQATGSRFTRDKCADSPIFHCPRTKANDAKRSKVKRKPPLTQEMIDEYMFSEETPDEIPAIYKKNFTPYVEEALFSKFIIPEEAKLHGQTGVTAEHNIHDLVAVVEANRYFKTVFPWIPHIELPHCAFVNKMYSYCAPKKRLDITRAFKQNLTMWTCSVMTCAFGFGAAMPFGVALSVASVFQLAGVTFLTNLHRHMHDRAIRGGEMLYIMGNWKAYDMMPVMGYCAAIIAVCQSLKMLKNPKITEILEPQSISMDAKPEVPPTGSEIPASLIDDPKFRASAPENVWSTQSIEPGVKARDHLGRVSYSTASEDLEPLVKNNIYRGNVYHGERHIGTIQGVVIDNSCFVVASHYLDAFDRVIAHDPDPLKVIQAKLMSASGKHRFEANLQHRDGFRIKNKDLAILHIPSFGSRSRLAKHLPISDGNVPTSGVRLAIDSDNKFSRTPMATTGVENVSVSAALSYKGVHYRGGTEHHAGLCGAPLIQVSKSGAHIVGFHTAGSVTDPYAAIACCLTQGEFQLALAHFSSSDPTYVPPHNEGGINLVAEHGKVRDAPPHSKSPLGYIGESHFELRGVTDSLATANTAFQRSPLSPLMQEICGSDGGSYYFAHFRPRWFGPQKTAQAMAKPGGAFPTSILKQASNDYVLPLLDRLKGSHAAPTGPLTDFQIVNGSGKKYEEPLNRNTSVGFPFAGKKHEHMSKLPPEDIPPEHSGDAWKYSDDVMDHFHEVDACLRARQRVHFLTKAVCKDEVHTKPEKCRIIYVGSTGMTMIGRKYFLPLGRFLQYNTTQSECCVGLNCFGPEAEAIYQHMKKFGADRIIAGDFSKYDAKLPSSVIRASLNVLITLAKNCPGYSPDDIAAMETFLLEMTNATIDYFGDVFDLTSGVGISGHTLTAFLNGIGNSLLLRCVYFTVRPASCTRTFQENVALLTYGDDNEGSVSPECDYFDMKVISRVLATRGITYTTPNKQNIDSPFFPFEEADFLKRNFTRDHELGVHVGALDPVSIFKPLHMINFNPDAFSTPEMMGAHLMNSALDEFFNHGRAAYDRRQQEFLQVFERLGIDPFGNVLVDFDTKLGNWHIKYGEQLAVLKNHSSQTVTVAVTSTPP